MFHNEENYYVYWSYPQLPSASYGERPVDVVGQDEYTILPPKAFLWLMNLHQGYLVFKQGVICITEPYMPSRFAVQFGYDQLYVENPILVLGFDGSLLDRARP